MLFAISDCFQVSMTTIGYGDINPVTGLAKIVLCIFGLVGTGFIAMPAVRMLKHT